MFPLKSTRKTESTPYITYGLILVNVVVFLWQLTLPRTELGQFFLKAAFIPCESHNFISPELWLNSFRTMFLHGGWLHIVDNMVFLVVFGPNVEDYFGKVKYLLFYFAAGFAANFMHMAFNWNVCVPTIGASGAIAGLMGAFFILYPSTRISTVAFFYRIPIGVVNVQAFYLLIGFFLLDLFNGLAALGIENINTGGVAVWAHVGGFLAGLLLSFVAIMFKDPPPVDPFEYLDD